MLICCKFNKKGIFSYDVYGLQELSTVVLTQLIALQLQFKWSSDSVMTILLLFLCCIYSTIIIILAHSCFYPCHSEMFFKKCRFCNKLRRSVKFQHAVNPSGPDLFLCKPLTFRLCFTESCMISTGRT